MTEHHLRRPAVEAATGLTLSQIGGVNPDVTLNQCLRLRHSRVYFDVTNPKGQARVLMVWSITASNGNLAYLKRDTAPTTT